MRQQLMCSAAAVAIIAAMSGPFASQAWAADAAKPIYKAPTAVAVVYDWTGFYVGSHIGMVTGEMRVSPIGDFGAVKGDLVQVHSGLHGGYNWQVNNIMYGIEADASARYGEGHLQTQKSVVRSSWDASLRARLGVLLSPRSLVYVTGGGALGSFRTEQGGDEPFADLLGGTRFGWTVGAGTQYALDNDWSARLEYRYTGWGSKTVTNDEGVTLSSKLTDQRINIGLTHKLGGAFGLFGKAPALGKEPAAAMAIYNWTGFYVGAHVGSSAGNMEAARELDGEFLVARGGFTQVLAGGHAGYDYQYNPNIVVGVEGDLNAKFGGGWLAPVNSRPTSSWDASVRARVGYLVTPRSLFYLTGGLAFGKFKTPLHEFDPEDEVELLGGTRYGWTWGTGVQYVLDSNWSTRIEYRATEWASKTLPWFDINDGTENTSSKLTDHRITVGLTYKAGGPARFVDTDLVAVNWTGFYVGGHVGGVAANLTYGNGDLLAQEGNEFADFTQVLVGGHAGYNHQLTNNIVIGIEGDLNAKAGHGWKFDDLLRPTSHWDASIRARLGYTPTARSLLYVTGGYAFGHFKTPQSGAQGEEDPIEEHIGRSRHGWTLGGGIQYALDPNWSARIDYRHTNWGTKTLTNITDFSNPPDFSPETVGAKLRDNRIAVGLSYKLGDFGKGPVVTRY